MADYRRRRGQNPMLAIIVISLLVIMGLIAWVERDRFTTSPDSGVEMPVDVPSPGEQPVNPNPNPGAPIPERGTPEQRL
jgi:hypothetical protein